MYAKAGLVPAFRLLEARRGRLRQGSFVLTLAERRIRDCLREPTAPKGHDTDRPNKRSNRR